MSYLGNDSKWKWSSSGWQIASNKKKYIHKYWHSSKTYDDISDGITTMSWAHKDVWTGQDYVIIFKNLTENPVKIKKVKIKMVSCNSGGKAFNAVGGWQSGGASGNGAKYEMIIRVFKNHKALKHNSGAKSEKTKSYTIPKNKSSNMTSAGVNGGATATFKFNKNTDTRTISFEDDCPVIQKNGVAAIHVRATSFDSPSDTTYIKFDMSGTTMEIEEEDRNYVWQFQNDKKWHLIKPAYIYTNGGFKPLEEVKKPK